MRAFCGSCMKQSHELHESSLSLSMGELIAQVVNLQQPCYFSAVPGPVPFLKRFRGLSPVILFVPTDRIQPITAVRSSAVFERFAIYHVARQLLHKIWREIIERLRVRT